MRAVLSLMGESPHFRHVLAAITVFVAIHVVGTVGYLLLGPSGTSAIDAFYMTFITVATIGYSEIVDLSAHPAGRLFTVVIALSGIGTMTYLFSNVTAFMLESDLNRNFRRRRMRAEIKHLSGHYIVCGAGRIGSYVISELVSHRRPFVVIESSRPSLDRLTEQMPHLVTLEGDASDDDLLEQAGIARAAGVFAVTGDDAKNLVISLSSKQLNPSARVVARVHDQRNAAKTLRAGADEIVSPDFTGGHRIAALMLRPQMVSLMDELVRSDAALKVEEVALERPGPGLTVGDLGHSPHWLLIAIREGEHWDFNPPPGRPLEHGQHLVVIANEEGRAAIEKALDGSPSSPLGPAPGLSRS